MGSPSPSPLASLFISINTRIEEQLNNQATIHRSHSTVYIGPPLASLRSSPILAPICPNHPYIDETSPLLLPSRDTLTSSTTKPRPSKAIPFGSTSQHFVDQGSDQR